MNTFMYKGRECYIIKVCRKRVVLGAITEDGWKIDKSLVIIAAPQTIIKNLSFVDTVKFKRLLRHNKH